MTMSLSTGLISGMDTGSLIAQLVAAEGAPQTALKSRLSEAQNAASAYRTVNTTFLAVSAAAETAMKAETWSPTKATSSTPSVAVSATTGAATASLSFTVKSVAATHSAVSTTRWASTSTAAGLSSITVKSLDGTTSKGTVPLDGTESLSAAAAKINKAALGVTASVIQTNTNQYALQLTSTKSGADASFSLGGAETFKVTTAGKNAELTIGSTTDAYSVFSASNTFEGVMAGTTITVSKEESTPVTVSVVSDPDSVATKVSALVDAVNAALTTTKSYTSNAPGSTAALKGDYSVTSLAGRLLDAVSRAVGDDGSPAKLGIELTRDGKVTFDKAKFLTALKADPAVAQRMIAGAPADNGPNGVVGGGDDVAAVTGLAGRLLSVARAASDTTTGTLVAMANGQDSQAKDIQTRIEAWDLRLAKRKETLTRQFTAMETALSSLRNQSTWLAGQINSLPSSS
jgi:flagellar capping protein FliD